MNDFCKATTPKRNQVRNKRTRGFRKDMTRKIKCIASERHCSCCVNSKCISVPCISDEVAVGIESALNSENGYSFCGNKFCEENNNLEEEVCVKKPSWESCGVGVEEKLEYSENEITCFIEVIKKKLRDSIARERGLLVCGGNSPAFEILGVRNSSPGASFESHHCNGEYLTRDICESSTVRDRLDGEEADGTRNIDKENTELFEDSGDGSSQDICGTCGSIILRHEKRYLEYSHTQVDNEKNSNTRLTREDFKIGDVGKSEELSKWGELDIANRLLANNHQRNISLKQYRPNENDVDCATKDKFEETDRFSYLDKKGFATLCRQLFRWSDHLSKKWRAINSRPHIVIHLLSIGYPDQIRRRASKCFDFIQNLQVTRLGWLANQNAQVLYILPSNQNPEMITLLRDLIKNVRPDVAEDRLWIIQPEKTECLKNKCLNGSRAVFQSPKTYRRIKMLTAGRQAFMVPGIIEEIDVLIASELRVPIMGPPLEFQNHFLSKSNIANFLLKINVDQPPFIPDVHNFTELCEGLARLMIKYPNHTTWLIKINYGINGLQTAKISFENNSSREVIAAKKYPCEETEKKLTVFLMEILPGEMILNKQSYKNYTAFFCDLEKYGGLLQACPYVDYRVLSYGIFVEHDAAIPEVCASADVFKISHELTTDLCYGIPQATSSRLPLEDLIVNVGIALRDWQYIGYFGMDILTFTNPEGMDKFFVVDIDPRYTDVIAFTDWVRFCLGVGSSCRCCESSVRSRQKNAHRLYKSMRKSKSHSGGIVEPEDTMERYAICSGKLYSNGLAKYCGTTLVTLCEERNVRYNSETKQGSMICPIDSESRALGLVSLYPKRSQAIEEFSKCLRVLHELSLEKRNDQIKTNMLELARALEKRELGQSGSKKKNETCSYDL